MEDPYTNFYNFFQKIEKYAKMPVNTGADVEIFFLRGMSF